MIESTFLAMPDDLKDHGEIKNPHFGALEVVRALREEKGLPYVDIPRLKLLASSSDQAQNQLLRVWSVTLEQSGECALEVDLLKMIKLYSEEELDTILKETVSFQLTEGCNGGCPYCFYSPHKPGIERKFSTLSIDDFLARYRPRINPHFAFYSDSDPFDHPDFIDIYWKHGQGKFVSTSVPRGGADRFVDFLVKIAKDNRTRQKMIRVTLAPHNIQRVEAALSLVMENLLNDPAALRRLDETIYFNDLIAGKPVISGDKIEAIPIENHFDFMACSDGVVIRPNGIEAAVMTYPTSIHPSGYYTWPIEPGKTASLVPRLRYPSSMDSPDNIILPAVITSDGGKLSLDDLTKAKLGLGRAALRISLLIKQLSLALPVNSDKVLQAATAVVKNQWDSFSEDIDSNKFPDDNELILLSRIFNLRRKELEKIKNFLDHGEIKTAVMFAEQLTEQSIAGRGNIIPL